MCINRALNTWREFYVHSNVEVTVIVRHRPMINEDSHIESG